MMNASVSATDPLPEPNTSYNTHQPPVVPTHVHTQPPPPHLEPPLLEAPRPHTTHSLSPHPPTHPPAPIPSFPPSRHPLCLSPASSPNHLKSVVLMGGLKGWAGSKKIWHVALPSTLAPRSDKIQLENYMELDQSSVGELSLGCEQEKFAPWHMR